MEDSDQACTIRRPTCIDVYQVVDETEDGVEIGGETDSQPVLFDLAGRRELSLAFCGTPCGYHWGR